MKKEKTISAIVRFTPIALKKIKDAQRILRFLNKKHNKSAAANHIIENSK